ncbi:peptidylprolyl isomerase [Paracoccus aurantiacus]|uniref:Parvulin-like PPIase n=1 Tax=Paracoccus aurantiacus TaxID=2599412 RepID=A0A5C6RZU4_9RHOB|nr:peptidylprolyl isomerase [Paracoccus aurantiacus]TXB67505.1 peptidylprolyl isomerase [Paracoccus aurantiacus]
MLIRTASAALMMAVLAMPALSQDADTVIAKVNDTEITLGQMAAMKLGLPPDMAGMPAPELWDMMLDQMIRQAAMAEVGEKTMTPRDKSVLEIDRRAYLAGAALERYADFEPTDEEIQAAYEKAFPADKPITEYDADHILLETEEAAKAVIDELAKGADFAKLAEERSVDTASGLNGGDLGWFTRDRMVKEFGDAVAEMEDGATSTEPVKSQFGWHVIKLNGSRVQEPPALADIRDALVQQIRREKVEAEIERITSEAKVEKTEGIDPAVLEQDILNAKAE